MLIKSTNRNAYGKKLILPEVGEIQLDEEGVVEVPSSIADLLCSTPKWEKQSELDGVWSYVKSLSLKDAIDVARNVGINEKAIESRKDKRDSMLKYLWDYLKKNEINVSELDTNSSNKKDSEDEKKSSSSSKSSSSNKGASKG